MKMLSKTLVLSGIVFCFLIEISHGYSDCGSAVGSVSDIKIENCDNNDDRCILKRGTNVSMEIDFSTSESTPEVKAVVYGIILDVPIPFALPNANACVDSGLKCPLEPNQSYKYSSTFPVLKKYPRVTVDVKWELQDANGKNIICVIIPAKIQ